MAAAEPSPAVGATSSHSHGRASSGLGILFLVIGVLGVLASVVWFAVAFNNRTPAILAAASAVPLAFSGLGLIAVGSMLNYLAGIAANTRRT
jgi:hypothetical protein